MLPGRPPDHPAQRGVGTPVAARGLPASQSESPVWWFKSSSWGLKELQRARAGASSPSINAPRGDRGRPCRAHRRPSPELTPHEAEPSRDCVPSLQVKEPVRDKDEAREPGWSSAVPFEHVTQKRLSPRQPQDLRPPCACV